MQVDDLMTSYSEIFFAPCLHFKNFLQSLSLQYLKLFFNFLKSNLKFGKSFLTKVFNERDKF